jgi:hypothetical protein
VSFKASIESDSVMTSNFSFTPPININIWAVSLVSPVSFDYVSKLFFLLPLDVQFIFCVNFIFKRQCVFWANCVCDRFIRKVGWFSTERTSNLTALVNFYQTAFGLPSSHRRGTSPPNTSWYQSMGRVLSHVITSNVKSEHSCKYPTYQWQSNDHSGHDSQVGQ